MRFPLPGKVQLMQFCVGVHPGCGLCVVKLTWMTQLDEPSQWWLRRSQWQSYQYSKSPLFNLSQLPISPCPSILCRANIRQYRYQGIARSGVVLCQQIRGKEIFWLIFTDSNMAKDFGALGWKLLILEQSACSSAAVLSHSLLLSERNQGSFISEQTDTWSQTRVSCEN